MANIISKIVSSWKSRKRVDNDDDTWDVAHRENYEIDNEAALEIDKVVDAWNPAHNEYELRTYINATLGGGQVNNIIDQVNSGVNIDTILENNPALDHDNFTNLSTNYLNSSENAPNRSKDPTFLQKHSIKIAIGGVAVGVVGLTAYLGLEYVDNLKEVKIENLQDQLTTVQASYDAVNDKLVEVTTKVADALKDSNAAKTAYNTATQKVADLATLTKDAAETVVQKGQSIWTMVTDFYEKVYTNTPTNAMTNELVAEAAEFSDKLNPAQFAEQFPGNAYPDGTFLENIAGNPHLIHPGDKIDLSSVTESAKVYTDLAADGAKATFDGAKEVYDKVAGQEKNLKTQLNILGSNAESVKSQISGVEASRLPGYLKGIALGTAAAGAATGFVGVAGKIRSLMNQSTAYSGPTPTTPTTPPDGTSGGNDNTNLTNVDTDENVFTIVDAPETPEDNSGETTALYRNNKSVDDKVTPSNNVYIGNFSTKKAREHDYSALISEAGTVSAAYRDYKVNDQGKTMNTSMNRASETSEKIFKYAFNDQGQAAHTARETANELNVSTSTVYKHIKTLRDITGDDNLKFSNKAQTQLENAVGKMATTYLMQA